MTLPGNQFLNHVVYVTGCYKGVVLDEWLHKLISLLAINKSSYRSARICLQLWFSKKLSPVYEI